jgi:hypothetical protein
MKDEIRPTRRWQSSIFEPGPKTQATSLIRGLALTNDQNLLRAENSRLSSGIAILHLVYLQL